MRTHSVSVTRSFALLSLALPFAVSCKGEKDLPNLDEVYKTQSCATGQHFEGDTMSCVADVAPVAVTGFTSYLSEDFNNRATRLQDFITQYMAANVPDLTLSVAPTCTETIEYNASVPFYNATHYNSFECAFTLSDANGAVLTFERQDRNTGIEVTDPAAVPTYANPVLKVVHSLDTDAAKLLICTYEAVPNQLFEKDGKYDTAAGTGTTYYPTLTNCTDYGTSVTVPASLESKPVGLHAFPASFNAYLKAERTAYDIGGQKIYVYAANEADTTSLTITCGASVYSIGVALTSDPQNPVTGKAVLVASDATSFFDAQDIPGADGFTYTKARSLLGCTTAECVTKANETLTYKFFGNHLVLNNGANRDVWTIGAGTVANFAEPGHDGVAPVCTHTYTVQPRA